VDGPRTWRATRVSRCAGTAFVRTARLGFEHTGLRAGRHPEHAPRQQHQGRDQHRPRRTGNEDAPQRDKVMFDNAVLFYPLPPGRRPRRSTPRRRRCSRSGRQDAANHGHSPFTSSSRRGRAWSGRTPARDPVQGLPPKTCAQPPPARKAACGPTYADEIIGQGILATTWSRRAPRNNDATGTYETDWILSQSRATIWFFNYAPSLTSAPRILSGTWT